MSEGIGRLESGLGVTSARGCSAGEEAAIE